MIKELSPEYPEVITSIYNNTIYESNINLLQVKSSSKIDVNELNSYLNVPGQNNLKLNLRFRLFKQLKNLLYIPLGVMIIFLLVRILIRDFLRRKQIYGDSIKKYYRFNSIKISIRYKPHIFILSICLIIGILQLLKFDPYFPPEIISDMNLKKLLLSPVKFIVNKSININPVYILPEILEIISFCIISFLYIPGIILLFTIKEISLRDSLFLPIINICFTGILVFYNLELIFDYKINLLLLLFVLVSAGEMISKEIETSDLSE